MYVIGYLLFVKMVFYVFDFNFGWIFVVIGYVGVVDFDVGKIDFYFDDVFVVKVGGCNLVY